MKFSYLLLYVNDLDASLALYRDALGLEISHRYTEDDGTETAFVVEKGETPMQNKAMLELVAFPTGPPSKTGGYLIGFEVDSLEETTAALLAHGFPRTVDPYSPAPGHLIAHFTGPDGEEIGIMQVDPAHRFGLNHIEGAE